MRIYSTEHTVSIAVVMYAGCASCRHLLGRPSTLYHHCRITQLIEASCCSETFSLTMHTHRYVVTLLLTGVNDRQCFKAIFRTSQV